MMNLAGGMTLCLSQCFWILCILRSNGSNHLRKVSLWRVNLHVFICRWTNGVSSVTLS
uniref:Uncharacterized protein n=1 Tax=Arundo donax TaxID=35708 RepID=A0A0A9B6Q3_ARUDO